MLDNLYSAIPYLIPGTFKKGFPPRGREVIDMKPKELGYIVPWSLNVVVNGEDVEWFVEPRATVDKEQGGTASIKILKNSKGIFEALIPEKDSWGYPFKYKWTPYDKPDPEWFPVRMFSDNPADHR